MNFAEIQTGHLFYFIQSSNDINRYIPGYLRVSWWTAPEASCPNVGQEWGAKHSTLFKFATRFIIFYIFDEYVFSIFENMDTSLLTVSKISELQENFTKIDREKSFCDFVCCAEQIVISINIVKRTHCLRNYYEWIYLLRNISTSESYQSTSLLADLHDTRFCKSFCFFSRGLRPIWRNRRVRATRIAGK